MLKNIDFALDEYSFINRCFEANVKGNTLVAASQRCAELFLKVALSNFMDESFIPKVHSLRELHLLLVQQYKDAESLTETVRLLDTFYTHTRYPGYGSYIATNADIDIAVNSLRMLYSQLYLMLGGEVFKANGG